VFYHDVRPELAKQALAHERRQSDTPGSGPGHLLLGRTSQLVQSLGRNDRFFPVEWLQTLIRDRLRIVPDEIDSGHCPALSRPHELAELLDGYRTSEDRQ
jgi:hypothetical protein